MSKRSLLAVFMATLFAALVITTWRVDAQSGGSIPPQQSLVIGQAMPGLSEEEKESFEDGLKAFSGVETRSDGLGPVFNGTTCAECHKAGAIGGAGLDLTISRITRIGGMVQGVYSDLTNLGGPVLQSRSLREFDTTCPISGEVVPRGAASSRRITTPLFGAGLLEAIPEDTILANAAIQYPDGLHGVPNIVFNPETGHNEIGRFGWKGQHSSLHLFAGDAYLNEMGITTTSFPSENLPQGRSIPTGWEPFASPEDEDGDVDKFTIFMRLLAPPGRQLPLTTELVARVQAGEQLFNTMRCSGCHMPSMKTGPSSIPALSNQTIYPYSDLLLHRMGPGLADGIRQGTAQEDQFKTAPLWGLSRRVFFMHDGRTKDLSEAIAYHDGEAAPARNRFLLINAVDKAAVLAFLKSL